MFFSVFIAFTVFLGEKDQFMFSWMLQRSVARGGQGGFCVTLAEWGECVTSERIDGSHGLRTATSLHWSSGGTEALQPWSGTVQMIATATDFRKPIFLHQEDEPHAVDLTHGGTRLDSLRQPKSTNNLNRLTHFPSYFSTVGNIKYIT